MKKTGNTKKYRDDRRITSFPPTWLKKKVLNSAAKNGLSVSEQVAADLEKIYRW